jgi:phosphoribosylglycinamide formyltransferase 1
MKKIVIFASGHGSNAQNIILHFNKKDFANVVAIFTNNPSAKVIEIAKNNDIESIMFGKTELNEGFVLDKLNAINPDLIVLAGFLWKFPESIINSFSNKIINIHPALLPKYGGKGMYGINVHQSVLDNQEAETGITIHYVNKNYDEGEFIFQKSISITECKTAEEIAQKIHELEMDNFPQVIQKLITHNF